MKQDHTVTYLRVCFNQYFPSLPVIPNGVRLEVQTHSYAFVPFGALWRCKHCFPEQLVWQRSSTPKYTPKLSWECLYYISKKHPVFSTQMKQYTRCIRKSPPNLLAKNFNVNQHINPQNYSNKILKKRSWKMFPFPLWCPFHLSGGQAVFSCTGLWVFAMNASLTHHKKRWLSYHHAIIMKQTPSIKVYLEANIVPFISSLTWFLRNCTSFKYSISWL